VRAWALEPQLRRDSPYRGAGRALLATQAARVARASVRPPCAAGNGGPRRPARMRGSQAGQCAASPRALPALCSYSPAPAPGKVWWHRGSGGQGASRAAGAEAAGARRELTRRRRRGGVAKGPPVPSRRRGGAAAPTPPPPAPTQSSAPGSERSTSAPVLAPRPGFGKR
jgi:hypothetical protein